MKTVIEMAREAQMPFYWCTEGIPYLDKLERFAELVRADAIAKEREAMMQLFTDPENQPTQHGTVTVQYMQREIEAEREACARVAERSESALHCAAAIRARRNP